MSIKVGGPGSVSNVSKSKSAGKAGGDGSFSKMLDSASTEETHGTSSINRIAPVNFVSIVDGDEQGQRRRKLIEEADDLLDELLKIRDALLFGNLSPGKLQTIQAKLEKIEANCDNPRLNEIIEEVKVRAAVELAKLGRY